MSKLHYRVKKHGRRTSTLIVSAILDDFTDRRGLRQEWDGIDKEIQDEIIKTWIKLVEAELPPATPSPEPGPDPQTRSPGGGE